MKKYIAYYRVSTKGQEESGLGLLAQQQQVASYIQGKGVLLGSFTDIESGGKHDRAALRASFDRAKALGATLIIAKLDRLSRSVAFISALMESGIDFVCCDMPEANGLTIHILAAMAQHEREMISVRTKMALEQAKKAGKQLGSPQNLTQDARKKGAASNRAKSLNNTSNIQAYELSCIYRHEHGLTFEQIAQKLNTLGYRTPTGKLFLRSSVQRLLLSMKKASAV